MFFIQRNNTHTFAIFYALLTKFSGEILYIFFGVDNTMNNMIKT